MSIYWLWKFLQYFQKINSNILQSQNCYPSVFTPRQSLPQEVHSENKGIIKDTEIFQPQVQLSSALPLSLYETNKSVFKYLNEEFNLVSKRMIHIEAIELDDPWSPFQPNPFVILWFPVIMAYD